MKICRTLKALRQWRKSLRDTSPVVFIPTMGALHEGHLALLRYGRKMTAAAGKVIVSIFVNPAQFGPHEDFAKYPRPIARDLELLGANGCNAVFLPDDSEIYPADHSTWVEECRLSKRLCGASRPGHFRGVCTIVAKLFGCVQPTAAIFGEKDFQQLAVIRRMTRDLNLPVRIIGRPTVREADGLALSSRNTYLDKEQRAQAPELHRALQLIARAIRQGERITPKTIQTRITRHLRRHAPLARVDYIQTVIPETLVEWPPQRPVDRGCRILAAAWFGNTRLIDNVPV